MGTASLQHFLVAQQHRLLRHGTVMGMPRVENLLGPFGRGFPAWISTSGLPVSHPFTVPTA